MISFEVLQKEDPKLPQVHRWKMDPKTLEHSFSSETLSYEAFLEGFEAKYASIEDLPPLWILRDHQPVGTLYFEPWHRERATQISIFLDPDLKGQQIGSEALKLAVLRAFETGCEEITAFVQKGNLGAQKAFEKAGFECEGPVELEKHGKIHKPLKYKFLKKDPSRQVFIIAEAGSNFHVGTQEEDLKNAKRLILEAYKAGACAVKFQLYDAQTVYASGAGVPGYLTQDIEAIFKEYALPKTFISKLAAYAKLIGIEFMCSTFSVEHFEHVDPFVQRHKIASYEIRHLRLLESAALSKKPLILSTGASTEEDIEWAMDTFYKAGGKHLTLMHCNAQYPAEPEGLHLNCIAHLIKKFQVPCGFSDHSQHPLHAPLLAIALGATVLEKHFTLDRNARGPDHFFALECHELKEMVQGIREAEKMLGVAKKEIFPQEENLARFARRGLQALKTIAAGEAFIEDVNVGILRSGHQKMGLHPRHLNQLIQSRAKNTIQEGAGIEAYDVQWN